MGAKTAISAEQYLHTSFPDLDEEYRDGELVERSLPDYLHSRTQGLLTAFFIALQKTFQMYACPELRLRIREGLYRIPDVSVFHPERPIIPVPDAPPFVTIEILSPDDRLSEVRAKLEEYRVWGVPHVWLVDPHSRRMYTCDDSFREVASLMIPDLGVEIKPEDIFE
ncbi:MAG: Uma2 family endonuclease [Bryobacteraceae bacterium]